MSQLVQAPVFRPYHCLIPPWLKPDSRGYRRITVRRNSRNVYLLAHRISVTLFIGDPKTVSILHRCGNPGCCNPPHLYGGSDEQNREDAAIHHAAREILSKKAQDCSQEESAIWVPTVLPLITAPSSLPDFIGFQQCLVPHGLHSTEDGDARRLSFQLFWGPLAPHEQVDRVCDEKRCINPLHLVYAAQQPDPKEHKRLNDRRVRVKKPAILAMLDSAQNNREIGRRYGIHEVTVGEYRRRGSDFLRSLL